ncbi:hypothetical protein BH11GEM1_BH11GEM1_13220 [soil metagenome]
MDTAETLLKDNQERANMARQPTAAPPPDRHIAASAGLPFSGSSTRNVDPSPAADST